jgi:hypothetical protein
MECRRKYENGMQKVEKYSDITDNTYTKQQVSFLLLIFPFLSKILVIPNGGETFVFLCTAGGEDGG